MIDLRVTGSITASSTGVAPDGQDFARLGDMNIIQEPYKPIEFQVVGSDSAIVAFHLPYDTLGQQPTLSLGNEVIALFSGDAANVPGGQALSVENVKDGTPHTSFILGTDDGSTQVVVYLEGTKLDWQRGDVIYYSLTGPGGTATPPARAKRKRK